MFVEKHEMKNQNLIEEDALPSFAEDGTDLTLIRWMLSLTPMQRLQALQDRIDAIEGIRQANGAAPTFRDAENSQSTSS